MVTRSDPIAAFRDWFNDAQQADFNEPSAMTLATVSATGRPSARMVLLKDFDENGFVFFTNYESRKGQELAASPWASLVFWWDKLYRQVRIDGAVTTVDASDSDAYFATRPRGSQISAIASPQSTVIANRELLEHRVQELDDEFGDRTVPRPEYWGGYCVVPQEIEFWQGQDDRLHDRWLYRRDAAGSWVIERLAP